MVQGGLCIRMGLSTKQLSKMEKLPIRLLSSTRTETCTRVQFSGLKNTALANCFLKTVTSTSATLIMGRSPAKAHITLTQDRELQGFGKTANLSHKNRNPYFKIQFLKYESPS